MIRRTGRHYVCADLVGNRWGTVESPELEDCRERHRLELDIHWQEEPLREPENWLSTQDTDGLILELPAGMPYGAHMRLARKALAQKKRVWLWWPREQAVEHVDLERWQSLRRHRVAGRCFRGLHKLRRLGRATWRAPRAVARGIYREVNGQPAVPPPQFAWSMDEEEARLQEVLRSASPIQLPSDLQAARGAYLRTDYWAPISSGGSYGHTCYVAQSLRDRVGELVCFMPHRYDLLDAMSLQQVVLESPKPDWPEDHIVQATLPTVQQLRAALSTLRPDYIFERICLGNYAGALLSQELGIPYIVEYNGSEISMKRSFDGGGYVHEAFYLQAELAAFRQATLITVVSEPIREELIQRGIPGEKILVNPNGACPEAYAPPSETERTKIRTELGYDPSHCVIGFTGTFGGWHGIDVLAAALPQVCKRFEHVQFLLVGDGNFRHLVDEAIREHKLADRVRITGRVPQAEGARLLQACDLYVSPHNSHMVDSRFFGSPTKIFEYMSLGQGIVASNLEQMGEVLSPALTAPEVGAQTQVTDQRSLLCKPGDVEEFVLGINALVQHPEVRAKLGENARQAIQELYSWDHHVDRIWRAARGESVLEVARIEKQHASLAVAGGAGERAVLDTGDAFKSETQNQWNQDPCGSHYAQNSRRETLEWYMEVERYRYDTYAPWMRQVMEFEEHSNHDVLEIGAGLGTDLCQFARHGARVTDIDLSAGHLEHAQRNFALRELDGNFVHHDAETLPFPDNHFDLVYSNGVIHHTPNTAIVLDEIHRVLRPGGRTVLMVYAENSLHYWRNLFYDLGIKDRQLDEWSVGEIMSRSVEISEAGSTPLVKVYTPRRIRRMLARFESIQILQRQLMPSERPRWLRWLPATTLERFWGWNLVIKARKPK